MPKAPKSFIKKSFLGYTVLSDTLFSMFFLLVYRPFSETLWLSFRAETILSSLCFYAIAIAIVIISKFTFVNIFKNRSISMLTISLWQAVECVGLAAVYLIVSAVSGNLPSSGIDSLYLARVIYCIGMILFIPFVFSVLVAVIKDYEEEIILLKHQQGKASVPASNIRLVNLYDQSGVLRISTSQDDIFYVESQNNYVNINYLVDESMTSYLLRCSTAQIEDAFKDTSVIRCHRSFLVNLNHIKLLKHSKGRATIVLSDKAGTEVPVSRSYYKEMIDAVSPDKVIRST